MERSIVFAVVLTIAAVGTTAQGPDDRQKSPRKVVESFWKFETEGGRLSSEGWNKAGSFFVRPISPPSKKKISVVYKGSSISDPVIKGSTAQVTVEILPQGQIDSELQFTPSESYKAGLVYNLVLTDKHWELGLDGTAKELTGLPEWRIEDIGSTLWLSVDAAIHYVADVRDKITDPSIKKNADQTLAKLKNLH
jgi:hypothetical protein